MRGCSPSGRNGGLEKIPKVSSLCRSGGDEVRVVYQNHEVEKNSSEFFEALKNVMKNQDFSRAENLLSDLL